MKRIYNAAADLLDRHRGVRDQKAAYIDDKGSYSYAELIERVDRFAGHLRALGLPIETRIMLCMEDTIDFPVAALGTIKAGLVPVLVNPLFTPDDIAYLLDDSRAQALVVSAAPWSAIEDVVKARPRVSHVLLSNPGGDNDMFAAALAAAEPCREAAETVCDEVCLWQYSSGSTGKPKGTMHVHDALRQLPDFFPSQVLNLGENDITFSAAKLFFGYGFGNSLVFPLAVGATAILMSERPTATAVFERLQKHKPTIFYGVPTLYNLMLSAPDAPAREDLALRLCTSAGEALPAELGRRWQERYGTDIVDGIGSTEMLHIFMSNVPGDIEYGSTGRPLKGYEVRLLGENGAPVPQGEIGELHVKGPTAAAGYWNNREKSRATFLGEWVRSGDKFRQGEDGRYYYCGRSDDMLKVSGIYVSPIEIEAVLLTHSAVAEAAVVGWADDAGLIKPKAFVVLREGFTSSEMPEQLKQHVKSCLAPYKYPRWFDFVGELPKTATGKVERYRLRAG